MKKIFLAVVLLWGGSIAHAASLVDYAKAVESVSHEYHQQSRAFMRSLNPQQQGLSAGQQTQFCGIVGRYVDGIYQATDKNRSALDFKMQKMTKQDVIDQVNASSMMQLLKRKNVTCNFNNENAVS